MGMLQHFAFQYFHRLAITLFLWMALWMVLGGYALNAKAWAEPLQCANPAPSPALHVVSDTPRPFKLRLAESLTLDFKNRFNAVVQEAKAYLTTQNPKTSAIVVDLDETLLDNRAYYTIQESYRPESWEPWAQAADAPAIPESLSLIQWAVDKGFDVYFVSGRLETQRATTHKNLCAIGVCKYAGMYLKPVDYPKTKSPDAFKIQSRQAIEAKGKPVVMTLGDQASDLRGPAAGKPFLLPNPIYIIP